MLISRRLALEGVSETSSSACDTDADSGGGGGGDFSDEVDAVMAEVESDVKKGDLAKQIEFEKMKFELNEWRRKNAAANGGSTITAVPSPFASAPTGAAPVAAAAAEEKPKKIKRGQIPNQSVKYKEKQVSAYARAMTLMDWFVNTVTLGTSIQCHRCHLTTPALRIA